MKNFLNFICGNNSHNDIITPIPIPTPTPIPIPTPTPIPTPIPTLLSKMTSTYVQTDLENIFDSNTNQNPNLDKIQCKKLDLNNIIGNFYVDSVYDGDTITILIPIKTHIYNMVSVDKIDINSDSNKSNTIYFNKVHVRLLNLDTPEIKPLKDIPNRDEHIRKAKEARDFLSNIILNKIIQVKFYQNDKYGRPLVEIYHDSICLNELMITKGYGKKYSGGTKDTNF